MTFLGTLISFPVFNGLQQGELALLTAFLGGLVLMGSIALIILTHSQSSRALHVVTMLVAFIALLPNMWATYAISLVLFGYLYLALKLGSKALFLVTFLSAAVYLLLLGGAIIWYWPIQLTLLPLFMVYIAQLYELSLKPSKNSHSDLPEHNALRKQDVLGLPSRSAMRDAYHAYTEQEASPMVLVLIRLEGFEQVNFHLGREYGDLLLAQSANRIKHQLQNEDIVKIEQGGESAKFAHLGGLHFVFLCSLAHQQHLHEQVIGAIVQTTLKPFNVGHCTIEIKAKASYVSLVDKVSDFDNAITCAFLALDSEPKKVITEYLNSMQTAKQEQQAR